MKKVIICLAIVCCFAVTSMAAELLTNLGCEQDSGGRVDRKNGSAVIDYQTPGGGNGGFCIRFTGDFDDRVESDPISMFSAGFVAGTDTLTGSAYVNNANGEYRTEIYINCYAGSAFTNRSGEQNTTAASWVLVSNTVVPAASANGQSVAKGHTPDCSKSNQTSFRPLSQ